MSTIAEPNGRGPVKKRGTIVYVVFRAVLLTLIYSTVLILGRWLAFQFRFDFNVPATQGEALHLNWWWIIPLKIAVLALFGQYSGLLSYFSIPDLRRLFLANTTIALIFLWFRYLSPDLYSQPRGVVLLEFILTFIGLSLLRLSFRVWRERAMGVKGGPRTRRKRVAIVGAGNVGANLAKELLSRRATGLLPVAFFDDDASKWHMRIHEIPVIGSPEKLLDQALNLELEEVIIAMPSAPKKRIAELIKVLQKTRLKFEILPSVEQLATGQVKVSQLREVDIQDLLGREPVALETGNIKEMIHGRVAMVSGAGGSIGSELCRQIASFNPQRLLLVEQSEVQLFQVEQDLIQRGYSGVILPLVADILDQPRMRFIMDRFRPSVIFHAAAHKHVPMMENQPGEAIKNNTLGTAGLARLALEFGVDRFVLISTDKAINPTNVMGATKRMAEIFIQALHAANPGKTKFMAVRFGNVLGSSGSVIPTFKRQIANGGPVTVTHPDMTRYFMTIPEAVGLVLQSATQGSGGEIFVLDMGQPVKIVDLARQLIELSGYRSDEDIMIEFTGLRPGEKLFEELSHQGENITPTNHSKIMRFVCDPVPLEQINLSLDSLRSLLESSETDKMKRAIKEVVPEYVPYLS